MTLGTRCCTPVNRMLRRRYAVPFDHRLAHMARPFASWLSGPPPPEAGDPAKGPADYPGQRLGLPQAGPRSLARLGRRVGALLIDWLIAYGLAALGLTLGIVSMPILSTAVLVVWFVLGVISL